MTVLTDADQPPLSAGRRFRTLLEAPEILRLPGAHNGLAALQAKAAGFQGLYLSGAAMSASMGLPDVGLITVDDAAFFIRQVAGASGLPVLVDGDTGYGEALNVMATVRCFEASGAGAVHLEDQQLPKKCGHLDDKHLIPPDAMAMKIGAAVKARRDLVIIARTDAAASEGVEGAIARAKLYLKAGADAIFADALTSETMFRALAEALPGVPLVANMTEFGKTPYFSADQFAAMGYKMVIWPVSALRVAAKAQGDLYQAIAETGAAQGQLDRMQTRAELYELIDYAGYERLDEGIARSVRLEAS